MGIEVEDGMTPQQRALQAKLEAQARDLAGMLDVGMNPGMRHPRDVDRRTVGFALLLFQFGEPPQPATWISNAEREDMIRAVEEWLERVKARQ